MEKTESLNRGHQGKGTETAKGSEPNPVFERDNLCNSNMLATGMESFQASSHSPRVYFWTATKSTLRVKLSEDPNFLLKREREGGK